MCVHVCVCGWNELNIYSTLAYPHIYQFILCYTQAHTHTHTRILKPFEDSEPTGLKVDTAVPYSLNQIIVALKQKVPGLLDFIAAKQNQRTDRHVKFLWTLEDGGIYCTVLRNR